MTDLINPNTADGAKTLANLQILRDYMAMLPENHEHFDMWDFFTEGDGFPVKPKEVTRGSINECGTSACLLGHAALILNAPERYDSWLEYSRSIFPALHSAGAMSDNYIWEFLFSADWAHHNNTVPSAVKRLDYVLKRRTYPPGFWDGSRYGFEVSF